MPHEYLYANEIFFKDRGLDEEKEFEISTPFSEYEVIKEGVWKFYNKLTQVLPTQGWKIHVSSDYEEKLLVLNTVAKIAIENDVSFKHLIGESEFLSSNSKNQNRAASGKFIVLYPSNNDQFIDLLFLLEKALKNFKKAAYILSDMRWKNSNIYYRYGGFASIYDEQGNLCIKDEQGNLIKDERLPYYNVPEIAREFDDYLTKINKSLEEPSQNKLDEYEIQKALSFSNSGGVYLGTRKKDQKKVVIKEARNNTGLDSRIRTGKDRLKIEKNALEKLKDVKGVVNLIECFSEWEHDFLVEEYAEGETLHSWTAKNFPFCLKDDTSYKHNLHIVFRNLIKVIEEIHNKGIVMGDFQPHNIFIDKNLNVKLIDFETASDIEDAVDIGLAVPTFSHLGVKNNGERDWFALYKVIRFMLLPIYTTVETAYYLDNQHNKWIKKTYNNEFEVYLNKVKKHLNTIDINCSPSTEVERIKNFDDYKKSLLISLKYHSKNDKLLTPNNYKQFVNKEGMLNIDSGAAGVLWSLINSVPSEDLSFYKKWIKKHLDFNSIASLENGLFNGKCGIISTLHSYGFKSEAKQLLDTVDLSDVIKNKDLSLFSGQAGIGLFFLAFYSDTNDESYLKFSHTIAKSIIEKYNNEKNWKEDIDKGLLRGWSGINLFFTSLFKITREIVYAEYSKLFLKEDIDALVESNNMMQLYNRYTETIVPYVDNGAVGVGLSIYHYLNNVGIESDFQIILQKIVNVYENKITLSGGLLSGMSGLMLLMLLENFSDTKFKKLESTFIERLKLYTGSKDNQLLFAGEGNYRFSFDFSSGASGVIAILQCVTESNPYLWLPIINIRKLF